MKNISHFQKALTTLLYSWGSDAPPEAIWSFNELLDFLAAECNINNQPTLDEDQSNYDEVNDWLFSNFGINI